MFAAAMTYDAVAFPTRSPKRFVAMTLPTVRMLAVALTYVAFTFPVRSDEEFAGSTSAMTPVMRYPLPMRNGAYRFPVMVMFEPTEFPTRSP